MKIKIERGGQAIKTYNDMDDLKPNTFYEDALGAVYWTDCDGCIDGGVWEDTFVDPTSIDWPLRDSNVKSITITK